MRDRIIESARAEPRAAVIKLPRRNWALGAVAGELIVRAFGASALVTPHVTAWTLVRAVLVAVATGAIGSLYPAWRVTRLRPAEALG